MLATGMRIGEAIALTWNDVNWHENTITINKTASFAKDPDMQDATRQCIVGPPKTKTSNRKIPLLPIAKDLLATIKSMQEDKTYHLKEINIAAIKNIRNAKGLSQKQVTMAVGIPIARYSAYDNGLKTLSKDTANKLASVLGCNVDNIITKDGALIFESEVDLRYASSENQIVFKNKNGNMRTQADTVHVFKCILRDATISDLTIHGLRHTFATRGLEQGIPIKVMQELLGHSKINMTADLYTHVLPETKHNEIAKLSNAMTF
ncbi:MAG: tyrosine-type recombinase/integrase [Defluviitaleaceae bacterium]|nr:tyrosine-type recombinase/integrase [Defluviitaleaceae bacterium]MCL2273423.1 tyrosine-type recombinase/integrase [Defluviitaleaceae bacterium]